MSTAVVDSAEAKDAGSMATVADLLDCLGGIPPERILLKPAPGEATEVDWSRLPDDLKKTCELIDGTLVRKAMGYPESVMMIILGGLIREYLRKNPIAIVAGADGATRFPGGQLRMPDLSVVLRSRLPQGTTPLTPIAEVIPDLAVEILSPRNTPQELEKKVALYFQAGVRLIWIVDIRKMSVEVLRPETPGTVLRAGDFLTGADVLPGFSVSIQDLFDQMN
jgi:Uma2 family endonuclease